MAQVFEIRAKKTFAAPGVYGYDAEAKVEEQDGKVLYVHVNDYDEFTHYTVSETSIYEWMTGNGEEPEEVAYIEEYTKLSETKESKYKKVFDTLRKTVNLLEKGIE